jgi:phage portal protein BeeE
MAKTSLINSLLNRAPVPHTHRGTFGQTTAGDVPVENIAQMQNVSTVFAIIDGIASEVAASEWKLWRGDTVDDPERVEVKTHAALSVWRRPNPFYTLAEFLEASQQHYELTGEYWWVLASDSELNGRKITAPWPLELWPIRPDRIKPVPHPTKFISGFVHTLGRDETPLTIDQVIFNKRQNPMNPYRGLSPLGSLVYDLAGDTAAAQYNAVFFKNGAMPGGIIEAQTPLSDDDFDQLMQRWREQHRGTSNAHRVGYFENATFTPASTPAAIWSSLICATSPKTPSGKPGGSPNPCSDLRPHRIGPPTKPKNKSSPTTSLNPACGASVTR